MLIRIPLFVLYAIVALNITAFAILLQLDLLIFNSMAAKLAAWIASAAAWDIAYLKRHKSFLLRM